MPKYFSIIRDNEMMSMKDVIFIDVYFDQIPQIIFQVMRGVCYAMTEQHMFANEKNVLT
jgi:hypothetical protein